MGTRTAPDATGTPTNVSLSISLIDASEDITTVTLLLADDPTAAEINAYVDAYQAATQASAYKIVSGKNWDSLPDPTQAESSQRNSVKQGINMLFKDVAVGTAQTLRVVAPEEAVMDANRDIPVLAGDLAAVIAATDVVLAAGYAFRSAQYTERRERKNNPRVSTV